MRLTSIGKPSAYACMKSTALMLFCFLLVFAQQEDLTPPKAEIKLAVGGAGFTSDDGRIPHGLYRSRFCIARPAEVE
jgi:hypothetical protein